MNVMAAPDIVRRIVEALDEQPGADDRELAVLLRDEGCREIVLAAEPVFAAAAWIARTVDGRTAVLPVGMQSPEVQAVNAALHRGWAAEDIVLDPPLLA
jgi:hypothetical protein